ncbi:MAG: ATP-binding protein, partial [Candidatus Pacearchaeota archaeon]
MVESKAEKIKKYGAESIKVLEGLEGVRMRPAMYIGSTGKSGLHHLVFEVVDNSVDEAMAGHCDLIEVTINKDGSVTIRDNGRGIPVEPHPVYKKSALEIAVTKLHAGGKFEKGSYQVSGGLHGVGISVVAALSKLMKISVRRNGKIYQQEYKIGKPLYDVKIFGQCGKDETGTEVTFYPDDSIFSTTDFDFSILAARLKEIAFLNKNLKILLEEDDFATINKIRNLNIPSIFECLVVPNMQPKTKPKACNYGLVFCRGEIVTIYDAEDIPEPDQLKKSIVGFKKFPEDVICIQAQLNYFNANENFLTKMFTLEYSYWFDYMLPGMDRLNVPIPLG